MADRPSDYMDILSKHYYVKENSIGPPKLYLGTQYKRVTNRSSNQAWDFSTDTYVKEVTSIVFEQIALMDTEFTKPKSPEYPFSNGTYRPEY